MKAPIYQPPHTSAVTTLPEKTAGTGTSLKAACLLATLSVLSGLVPVGLAQEVPDTRGLELTLAPGEYQMEVANAE